MATGRKPQRSRFFLYLSAAMLLTVIFAFSPTFFLRARFGGADIPPYLVMHALVLTAWFAWLVLQAALIGAGRPGLHRLCGAAGVLLGLAVIPAGLSAALGYLPRMQALYGNGAAALERIPLVVWGNFGMLAAFAVLLGAAVLLRHRSAAHKRLMLIASMSLMGPAFARIGRFPVFDGISEVPFIVAGTACMFGLLGAHDLATGGRRPHPATVAGLAVFAVCLAAGTIAGGSAAGRDWLVAATGTAG